MCYNLLNYPDAGGFSADTALRNPFFRSIIQATTPDLLVVAELNSAAGYTGFLNNVMNAGQNQYTAAPYLISNDSERGLYYRHSRFQLLNSRAILTSLRSINEYTLLYLSTGDTLRIYAVHLKASSGSTNEQQRASEVDSLRKVTNALPPGSNFIVCGDFNIYGSTESAYQKLIQIQSGNQGHAIDPQPLSGIWNNPAYAIHHTQSPRIRSFGGGATGGMDDRFDMILYSKGIQDAGGATFVAGSLQAYGNDGNHYNDSINRAPNTAVSQTIANALHNASDHLPVVANFSFASATVVTADLGVTAFIQPVSSCPGLKSLQVRVKNFSTSVFNFSSLPVVVRLRAQSPSGTISNFSTTVNTGSLNAGSDMLTTLSPDYAMNTSGNYQFKAWTELNGDANAGNDTLQSATFAIAVSNTVSISPAGPVQICNGNSITLTATGGLSYSWSNGSTSSALTVNTAGSYSVTATLNGGCTATAGPVVISLASGASGTLFTENMGNVLSTTSIATHENNNGFENDNFTMSGSGDVRNTLASSGYTGASGGANIFLTNFIGRNFQIAGINSNGYTNLPLSFAVYKNISASTGSDLLLQVSSDGISYQNLTYPALPSGTGWYQRTASGIIPATGNLRIRFVNNGSVTQYRIDDLALTGTPAAVISSGGGNSACNASPLVLTANAGSSYLWNTGATTQSITVTQAGSFQVFVDCSPSPVFAVNDCPSAPLTLNMFIEGYYLGNGLMRSVLYESGLSSNPDACDSVTVTLYENAAPYDPEMQTKALLEKSGNISLLIPSSLCGRSYFIGVMHRNSLETWSKQPVQIPITGAQYRFSD
jgi:endonuclease/exonuclease/phosphatase family metal-dependent hydrolase